MKQQLKDLVEDLPQLFARLKGSLLPSCVHFNDILNLETQYTRTLQEWLGGRIAKADSDLVVNRVIQALLTIIDAIQPSDLKPEISGESQTALHDYHRFTCDRVDQSDRFQQLFAEKREQKTHFFYLLGMDLQSHRGMFRRIAYDLEGRLQDYLNPGIEFKYKSLQIELTFDVSRDPEIYKQNILKSLFASLSIRVNEHEPLMDKDITWLKKQSPLLDGLGAEDFVSIFVGISEWDWDKDITPAVTRWFITEFCKGEMPQGFPTILFFFAIIYEDDDSPIEQEVKAVLQQSTHVTALPELGMVNMRDIGAWFNKYSFIAPSARELKDLRTQHFGASNEHYMDDVERVLLQLIDEYNRRFFNG
ncbi:MAG: hypothetical protein H6577_15135 [Lewinellaceae bacterium]|nr:hypothetical protein [Saprospiraceae bacterium]MCB9339462.1 hypothetical protein [Lewinellaceae bacterium]